MEHLTGINIRTGLNELNLPVKEIFRIKTAESGDPRIKELHDIGSKKALLKYPDLEKSIDTNNSMVYTDKKSAHKLTENLTAYVFDSYIVYRNINKGHKILCEKTLEIEFINSELLSFDSYCSNLMTAQAFSGNYSPPVFLYPFIGIGDFTLEEYANTHQMVVNTNCNMILFFVYYKNILSSIDSFISAQYEEDIKSQKKYINEKEYRSIMKSLRGQRQIIASHLGDDTLFDDEMPEN